MMKNYKFFPLLAALIFLVTACSRNESVSLTSDFSDMTGKTVAVNAGSVQDIYASQNIKGANVVRFKSTIDCYVAVSQGAAYACLSSSLEWPYVNATSPELMLVTDTIKPQPVAFAFSMDNVELVRKFNAFQAEYMQTDSFSEMVAEWKTFGNSRQLPDLKSLDQTNGVLHVVVMLSTEPFCFSKDGKVAGIEAEILVEFAKSQNMGIEFTDVDFAGIIPMITTGRADVGAALICVTEERSKMVNFSDPWIYESQALIVRDPDYVPGETDRESFLNSLKQSFERNLIKEKRYLMMLDGLKMTMMISLLAALLGTLLGALLCMGSMSRRKYISAPVNFFVEFMRCMPQVVLLLIMFYVVFGNTDLSGGMVAVVTFALCFAAYTSVIFKSAYCSIDKGQREAALALGFSPFRSFVNFILPQLAQVAFPVYKGELIGLIKATSIVGYIAVMDLTRAGDIIRSRTFEAFFPLIVVALAYFAIILLVSLALNAIEVRNRPARSKFSKR